MSEQNKNLIAFCGLYCGDCHGYAGTIPDLACDLRKELRKYKYDKFAKFLSGFGFAKELKNYETCYNVLGFMVKFRCRKGCRNGGGYPFCKIRKCCQKKGIDGCWECNDFKDCNKLDFLKPVHGDAHIKNLKKIKRGGKEKFIEEKRHWYSKIKE